MHTKLGVWEPWMAISKEDLGEFAEILSSMEGTKGISAHLGHQTSLPEDNTQILGAQNISFGSSIWHKVTRKKIPMEIYSQ